MTIEREYWSQWMNGMASGTVEKSFWVESLAIFSYNLKKIAMQLQKPQFAHDPKQTDKCPEAYGEPVTA